jgi:hypothetical protein
MTKCNTDKSQLILYLYGELDNKEKTILEAHLESCSECRTEADDYRKIMDKLARMPELEPANVVSIGLPYHRSKTLTYLTYGAIAASFLILAVATYLKLPAPRKYRGSNGPTAAVPTTIPNNNTVKTIPVSHDNELYAWDSGISGEIDSLKESATTIVNDLKTRPAERSFGLASPLASLDDSLDKIDTDIKTKSTETD